MTEEAKRREENQEKRYGRSNMQGKGWNRMKRNPRIGKGMEENERERKCP